MRKCVTCGVTNSKRKFVDLQCEDCHNNKPVEIPVFIDNHFIKNVPVNMELVSADLEKLRVKNKEEYKVKVALNKLLRPKYVLSTEEEETVGNHAYLPSKRTCVCGARIRVDNMEGKCGKCLREELRVIREANKKVKSRIQPEEKVCKACKEGDSKQNPLRVNKRGTKLPLHVNCTTRKTLEEIYLSLPEEKICNICDENKSINDYYFNKGGAYNHCKKCHYKLARAWQERNREYYLKYLSNYHKEYMKKLKGTGKTKLHDNRPLSFMNLTIKP